MFIAMFIVSCKKKDNEYIISGTVINPELNSPIGQTQLSLWGTKISSGIVQNQQEKIGTTVSSSNGTFEFRFKKEVYSNLKIILNKENYFENEYNINPQNLKPGDAYTVQIPLHARSWLKTIIKNVDMQNANDQILYKLTLPYQNCHSCCSELEKQFTGIGVDTSWVCPVYGNKNISVLWVFSNGQQTVPHNDTLFIQPFDTVLHTIFY